MTQYDIYFTKMVLPNKKLRLNQEKSIGNITIVQNNRNIHLRTCLLKFICGWRKPYLSLDLNQDEVASLSRCKPSRKAFQCQAELQALLLNV